MEGRRKELGKISQKALRSHKADTTELWDVTAFLSLAGGLHRPGQGKEERKHIGLQNSLIVKSR